MQSDSAPGGIGEPGTSVLLPAFVNAVHAATGKRLYASAAKAEQLNIA